VNTAANTKVVRDIYAAFGRGDMPAILGVLDENVRWSHPRGGVIPWGGERRGHVGATEFFAALIQHLDVERFAPRAFVAEGDYVVVTGVERMRVKATGRSYEVEWVHAFTLRDGRVTEFAEYTDTATIEAALVRD
jgi:ketosteroid isomerase-like protein